jgi:hypothetical protein
MIVGAIPTTDRRPTTRPGNLFRSVPQPGSLRCALPRATGAVGEASEGRLLRLAGTMVGDVVDDVPFGLKLEIDDGSGPIQLFIIPAPGSPPPACRTGWRSRWCASVTSSTRTTSATRAARADLGIGP